MKLADYNTLAYQFAIRNPRVIELLGMEINNEVVKELLTFGIDATSVHIHHDGENEINSIQELYLDYDHLDHIKHHPYSPYGEGQWRDSETLEEHNDFKGYQRLIHPLNGRSYLTSESTEEAIPRIKYLIEARGKKLQRLINGEAFKHYDAVTFFDETVYSLDTTGNIAKTIRSDIKFITEWIQPEKYLQLLPLQEQKKLIGSNGYNFDYDQGWGK